MAITITASIHQRAGVLLVEPAFFHLTDEARRSGSLLYESQDAHGIFTGFSIGVVASSVCVSGRGNQFLFEALDVQGRALLPHIQANLPSEVTGCVLTDTRLTGVLTPDVTASNLEERLHAVNHMALIRLLMPILQMDDAYQALPIGLFGGFSYDMVRQFEVVPASLSDPLNDADYCFYLPSQLFIVDHSKNCTSFVSLIGEAALTELIKAADNTGEVVIPPITLGTVTSDVSRDVFLANVEVMKSHIFEGDIFQGQYGRLEQAPFQGNPFLVYQQLKKLNPSPYMFFSRDAQGVTLGCSPELAISVSFTASGERELIITPIAGTKPRGFVDGKIHPQLDQRYEIALQTDVKELAEHVMLIDLARNDIAAIAKSGTTIVDESIVVKKYSHVQHLVSRVTGLLRDDIDALTAYLATMNMGTLTGAPKVEAMQLIATYELTARGFYGGGIGFITHRGEMETAIVIRSMRIKNGTVFLRASAGIVADSVPASEYQETVNKLRACRRALEEAAK